MPDLVLAQTLFDRLREQSFDGLGITRDSYGPGEERAHELMTETAQALGLEVARDGALNSYFTFPGRDRSKPAVMTGSHLDSVPAGGNFDGAAGVVAGMAVFSGWRKAGFVPERDVVVMGIRAEESTWFPYSYLGSKAAFGLVDRDVLELRRADTGMTLAQHMTQCGGDPAKFGPAYLDASRIDRFVELHIEQGPVLVEEDIPVGIVTGIRGSLRYRDMRFLGEYAHSGAVPRQHRRDAVRAAALFMSALDQAWERQEADGDDLVVTCGICTTDPRQHAFSKVAGELHLALDMRSQDEAVLARLDDTLQEVAHQVAATTRVDIEFGAPTGSRAAKMDADWIDFLQAEAKRVDITARLMASGAGHDCACFAQEGVPCAMIFVRNANGSHNPDEAMDMSDFEQGTRLLDSVLRAP